MTQEQRYFIKTYYIGDNYHGSQRQPDRDTIEGAILNALVEKNYINNEGGSRFEAASRTDRDVSSRGAVFSFISSKKFYPEELNSALPIDIGVWSYSIVPLDYLPRWNAISRHYKYIFDLPVSYYEENSNFNINLIKRGCELLKGRHDFVNFSKKDKNIEKETVKDLDIVDFSVLNNYIVIDFHSKSFLRQQVRRMIKKLIDLGNNEINLEEFNDLFDSEKEFSYKPADPKGLILWDIYYPEVVNFIENKKGLERMSNYFNDRFNISSFRTLFFEVIKEK